MKMKRYRVWFQALLLCTAFTALETGCAAAEHGNQKSTEEVIQIPMILTVDPSTGKNNEQDVVDAFNLQYTGKYHVDVEWIMETEEEYRQNLKRLNVTDNLPAIITDLRMLPSFYQMMVADERIEDLSSLIREDTEWYEMIEDIVLDGCTEPNGKIYLAPLSTAAFSCSGIFWNEELFSQAGMETFPETWKEFWKACEQLKKQDITPLALHTEGTAWAPMLLATAELAATEDGLHFMKQLYPASYSGENGLHLAKTLKRLFSYTTKDALHNDFDVAYSHFFSGEAAMLPNGYWMIDQIPENQREHIRFSPFPENKLISSPETFGWSIVSSYDDAVKEGAAEFFKFRTKMNLQQKKDLFSKKDTLSKAERDYIHTYQANPQLVPNYQVKWNSILQEETLGDYLPRLANGSITPEEFTRLEDESIRQFAAEQ